MSPDQVAAHLARAFFFTAALARAAGRPVTAAAFFDYGLLELATATRRSADGTE